MRIRIVVLALVCLLAGAALTPIVSPSAKGKKGSSCKNPYKTIKSDGYYTGDKRVVRVSLKRRSVKAFVTEVTLTVKPRPGFRICKVFLKHSGRSKTAISFPPRGGTKVWTLDEKNQKVKQILGTQVYSRKR